jgi:hypothetical protein
MIGVAKYPCVAQLVRASLRCSGGRGFESQPQGQYFPLAQLGRALNSKFRSRRFEPCMGSKIKTRGISSAGQSSDF